MIAISKEEKDAVLAKYPDTHIVRTMRQDSKRHHYYMTEDRKPMMLLRKIRECVEVSSEKGRVDNRAKQKRRRV